jgi:hypothetical protein
MSEERNITPPGPRQDVADVEGHASKIKFDSEHAADVEAHARRAWQQDEGETSEAQDPEAQAAREDAEVGPDVEGHASKFKF